MSVGPSRTTPELSEYEKNRLLITDDEWRRYDRMWVALSLDGGRIIAGAQDLVELELVLRGVGESIGNVGLEFVDVTDEFIGGQAETI